MGSSEDTFCLKWNDFHTSITTSFTDLRREKYLFDITIVCDGQHFQAHRLILSACSGVFSKLFKSAKSQNREQLVMLWDIKAEEMATLLNFMYKGQVDVTQEKLGEFLAAAEKLQIRGLTNFGEKAKQAEATREIVPEDESSLSASPTKRLKVRSESELLSAKDDPHMISNEHIPNARPDHHSNPPDFMADVGESSHHMYTDSAMDDDGNGLAEVYPFLGHAEHMMSAMDAASLQQPVIGTDGAKDINLTDIKSGPGMCPYCYKHYRQLRRHVEDIHLPQAVPCTVCHKVFSSYNKMQSHRSVQHKGNKYN
eukprot:maker-scaffold726_size105808-snap-gene-0.25 protein:Tk01909 transcript:maker-scaffold726_size105808-snap-gene-0.25-mRNA-1 annotation:"hypothetical protein TcasGA2_TC012869"